MRYRLTVDKSEWCVQGKIAGWSKGIVLLLVEGIVFLPESLKRLDIDALPSLNRVHVFLQK